MDIISPKKSDLPFKQALAEKNIKFKDKKQQEQIKLKQEQLMEQISAQKFQFDFIAKEELDKFRKNRKTSEQIFPNTPKLQKRKSSLHENIQKQQIMSENLEIQEENQQLEDDDNNNNFGGDLDDFGESKFQHFRNSIDYDDKSSISSCSSYNNIPSCEFEMKIQENQPNTQQNNEIQKQISNNNNRLEGKTCSQSTQCSQQTQQQEEKMVSSAISLENCEKANMKIIEKKVQGIVIVDVHQMAEGEFIQGDFQHKGYQKLRYEIVRSFRKLHNGFAESHSYLKMMQFEKQGFFSKISEFEYFSVNLNSWPFVASFSLKLSVPVEESVRKIDLFCEQNNAQCHEIFDCFQPNQITLTVQFWKHDSYIENILMNRDQKKIEETYQQQKLNTDLKQAQIEINNQDFQQNYKELMNLGEGSFGKVDLFYDFQNDRLIAVKTFADIVVKMKEKEEEMKNLIEGLRNQNQFNDMQIQGQTKEQQRNIAREIKQLLELNFAKRNENLDERRRYVLEFMGVIPVPKFQNSKVMQKLGGPEHKKYKGMKICFNFFGGCEYQNKNLTCDVRQYLKTNTKFLFGDDQGKKLAFIKDIFTQILQAFSFVHENNVVLRDFKDDNILIRRRFDPKNGEKSIFEIQLCDFGMSKKKPDFLQDSNLGQPEFTLAPLTRTNSIPYNAINRFRHPRFYKALVEKQEIEYEKKDDIFGLGILLVKLYDEHLKVELEDNIKHLVEYLTGFKFEIVEKYYNNHSINDYNQACQQLLNRDCPNWQECWENIPNTIQEIFQSQLFQNWMQFNSISQQQ